MDFAIVNNARVWLYRRRHPVWFSFIEPVLARIAAALMIAGLFLLEAVAILLVGIVVVLPFVY